MNKSKTQFGECDLFECTCGSHIIRIIKDEPSFDWPIQHSLQFWELRGTTNWNLWDRIKLGFRIIFGKECKYATYDVILNDQEVLDFANSLMKLLEPSKNPYTGMTLAEVKAKLKEEANENIG